jgi:hypothetical protein
MVFAANQPAIDFYRQHGLEEQACVDAFAFFSDHMGVQFPPNTPPLPALILRFTSAD